MILIQCDSDFFYTQVHFIDSNLNIENHISSPPPQEAMYYLETSLSFKVKVVDFAN